MLLLVSSTAQNAKIIPCNSVPAYKNMVVENTVWFGAPELRREVKTLESVQGITWNGRRMESDIFK